MEEQTSLKPGACFDRIPIVGGSHIIMILSRDPFNRRVGPEINCGGVGYTFPTLASSYELEIHFSQPFTMQYVFIPKTANVATFKIEVSHAGMSGVFYGTPREDGIVADGFSPMLVSMLVITFVGKTQNRTPGGIVLSIVCSKQSLHIIHDVFSLLMFSGHMQSDLFTIECKY